MTQAVEILAELLGRGVSVAIEGDILCLKPRRALDEALLARVRDAKPAILEAVRKYPPTYSAFPTLISAPATCWHCGGLGECNCSTCGVMKPSIVWTAGKCVACKPGEPRVQ